jgi:hypothetical protein
LARGEKRNLEVCQELFEITQNYKEQKIKKNKQEEHHSTCLSKFCQSWLEEKSYFQV